MVWNISVYSTIWNGPGCFSRKRPRHSTRSHKNSTCSSRTSTRRIRTTSPTCSVAMRLWACDSVKCSPGQAGKPTASCSASCRVSFSKRLNICRAEFENEVNPSRIELHSCVFSNDNLIFYLLGNSASSINSSQSIQSVDQKMTLVFFIGGCTYAEVSAFRFLSESSEGKRLFLFCFV